MQFSIIHEKHRLTMVSTALPEEYEKYQIPGSEVRALKGDFGTIISQLFHEQDLYISFQILDLIKETWLRFPFERKLKLLFYVCEGDLILNVPSNAWEVSIKEGQFHYMDFETIQKTTSKDIVINSGNSKFFILNPLDTNYKIGENINFQDEYFTKLCEQLKAKAKTH